MNEVEEVVGTKRKRPHGRLHGEKYAVMVDRVWELMTEGWDGPEIVELMNHEGFTRADGHPMDVRYLYSVVYAGHKRFGKPLRPGFVLDPTMKRGVGWIWSGKDTQERLPLNRIVHRGVPEGWAYAMVLFVAAVAVVSHWVLW